MNEKLNDKPIEMPARGRPRKKEVGLEHSMYGKDYEVQNNLYNRNNFSQFMNSCSESNSILDYLEGSTERESSGISSMYPYKNEVFPSVKEKNSPEEVMDDFNRVGEIFSPFASSSYPTEESIQVSPKHVQHGRPNNHYKSSSYEQRTNSSTENEKNYSHSFGFPHQFSELFTSNSLYGDYMVDSKIGNSMGNSMYSTMGNSTHSMGNSSIPSIYEALQNRAQKINSRRGLESTLDFKPNPNNYIDPFQGGRVESSVKRVNINTPIQNIPQYSPGNQYSNYGHYGRQQWYPSFPSENQIPLSQFRNNLQYGEGGYNNTSNDSNELHDTLSILGANPWYQRKKRKSNPLLWQYTKHSQVPEQNIMHPSNYSSIRYIQGVDSNQVYPLKKNPNENNSILPLFLSSNKELTDEHKDVVSTFKQRIAELDFTNVTVQQLKLFMREFGLNHTGKKNELIDRLKSTLNKLDNRNTTKVPVDVKKPPESKDDGYGAYFF